MPQFQPDTGAITMGVAGNPASVNNSRVSSAWGGSAVWLDRDRVLYRSDPGVVEYHVGENRESTALARQAWMLAGDGQGRWIGSDGVGVFGQINMDGYSLGLHGQDGRGAMAPDGTVALVRHGGRGFELWGVNTFHAGPDVVALDLCVLSGTRAIWRDAAGTLFQTGGVDLGPPDQRLPAAEPIYVETPHGPWLVYFCGLIGLIAHPVGSLMGVAITRAGEPAFYPDAYYDDVLGLRVTWSVGAAELPGEGRVINAIDSQTRVDLRALAEGEPPEPDPIVAIGKPCWLGFIEFTNTLTYDPPGNCFMWVHQGGIVTRKRDDQQFALWVQRDAHEPEDVSVIEEKASQSAFPVFAYWDKREWPRYPELLPPGSWLAIQGYGHLGESPAAFEADMRRIIESIPPEYPQIAIVCQTYTNPGFTIEYIKALVPVYARLARDYPRVNFLKGFSDQGRDTGMKDHPTLVPLWAELFAGITGEPGDTPVADNGIVDGVCVDPKKYFFSLAGSAEGQPAGDWRATFNRPDVIAGLELYGFGLQRRTPPPDMQTLGEPSSRIYVPSAVCPNAKPRPGVTADLPDGHTYTETQLGVIQTPLCWEGWIDTVDDATQTWTWRPSGNPYVPMPADPDPHPAPVVVFIHRYDPVFRRSSTLGGLIEYEAASERPIVRITLTISSGEHAYSQYYHPPFPPDGRYYRAIGFKPVISGKWTFTIEAENDQGQIGRSDPQPFTVVE